MKILHLVIIAASFVTLLLTGTGLAVPSGPPHFELGLELDKVLYNTGDTVMMHVWGSGTASENSTVYVKILDATADLRGTSVIYQGSKNLQANEARLNYTIPIDLNSNSTYRFLVQVYQNPNDLQPVNGVYFVTRDGAQRLVISSVNVSTPTVIPGQLINFTAKVTDGLGYTVSSANVRADLPQTDGGMDYLMTDAHYDNSTNLFKGSIPVPQSWSQYPQQNGTYSLRIQAYPTYLGPEPMSGNYSDKGIVPVEIRNSNVQIFVENPCIKNPTNQFCISKVSKIEQIHLHNSEIKPGDSIQYDLSIVDNQNNPIDLDVDAELFYQASWGPSNLHGIGGYDNSGNNIFHGSIGLPQEFPSGNYTIDLFLPGNSYPNKPDGQIPIHVSGANSIPEFPFAIPILLVSITSLIIFTRIRK